MPLDLVDDNREALIDGWLAAARACVEHWDTHRQFSIAGSKTRKFQVCYPLAAHAVNQVRASLVLMAEGLHYMARVNARVAFEHALLAQWIILTFNGEEAVVNKAERHRRAIMVHLRRVTELPSELESELSVPLRGAELPKIQDICDRFDNGKRSVYSLYRQLTGSVHVSLDTVSSYMDFNNEGVERLLSAPRPKDDTDFPLAVGWSAILAVDTIESLRRGRPFRAKIQRLAASYTLPSDLRAADTMPHLQRRPSP